MVTRAMIENALLKRVADLERKLLKAEALLRRYTDIKMYDCSMVVIELDAETEKFLKREHNEG